MRAILLSAVIAATSLNASPLSGDITAFEIRRIEPASAQSLSADYLRDTYLVGRVAVGTPPKLFDVSIETGNSNFFVFGQNYAQRRRGQTLYNPRESSTSRLINFGYNLEDLFFGNTFEENVTEFREFRSKIGVVDKTREFPGGFPAEGVLGLGWNVSAGVVPRGGVDSPPIGNILGASGLGVFQVVVSSLGKSGIIAWGRASFCGDRLTLPLVPTVAYPAIRIQSFSVGSTVIQQSAVAALDTGSSHLSLPQNVFDSLIRAINPTPIGGRLVANCNGRYPELTLNVGGERLIIHHFKYLADVGLKNGKCVLAVGPADPEAAVLGIPFFRGHCVGFDISRRTAIISKQN